MRLTIVGKLLAIGLIVEAFVVASVFASNAGAQVAWYAARASGMVAYLLAAGSVAFGIATSTKLGGRFVGQGHVADVHRALSLLTVLAIGAHALFLGLDQYANFTLSELFIPFVTWYRPVWTSLGIVAAYIALAVYVSFYLRPHIGYKAWRSFHYLAFAMFGMGTLHGMFAGTDSRDSWALGIYAASTVVVLTLLIYRISVSSASRWACEHSSVGCVAEGPRVRNLGGPYGGQASTGCRLPLIPAGRIDQIVAESPPLVSQMSAKVRLPKCLGHPAGPIVVRRSGG